MPHDRPAADAATPIMQRDPADRRVTVIEVGTRDGLQIEPTILSTARKVEMSYIGG